VAFLEFLDLLVEAAVLNLAGRRQLNQSSGTEAVKRESVAPVKRASKFAAGKCLRPTLRIGAFNCLRPLILRTSA
jgi:hypothetical protein